MLLGKPHSHPTTTNDTHLFEEAGAGGACEGGVREESLNPVPLPSALKVPHPNLHPLLHGVPKESDGDGDGSGGGGGGGGAVVEAAAATTAAGDEDEEERAAREGIAWAETEAVKSLDYGATDLKV